MRACRWMDSKRGNVRDVFQGWMTLSSLHPGPVPSPVEVREWAGRPREGGGATVGVVEGEENAVALADEDAVEVEVDGASEVVSRA